MAERGKGKPQKLKQKHCAFPDCGVAFVGRGKAKYCSEHRKPKYRKDLYKQNDNNGEGIVIIEHEEVYATKTIRECGLDGCSNEYEINLVPRLFEYPHFCEIHRNEYRRNIFVVDHKKNDS